MSLVTVETVVDDDNADEYVVVEKENLALVPVDPAAANPSLVEKVDVDADANPRHQFRSEPMEWDELVDIITVQNALEKLVRSEQQQGEYEAFLEKLLMEWATVSDHVLCGKFPKIFTKQLDEETQKYVAHPPLKSVVETGNSYVAVVRNDFPYHMAKGIEHWIVWKVSEDDVHDEDIAQAKSLLASRLGDDMLHWVNPPHLKSLPELDHIHILGKFVKPSAEVKPEASAEDAEDKADVDADAKADANAEEGVMVVAEPSQP
jgi:Protein of unknown function (DUF3605)